jgi:hypothetical protein
MSRKWSGPSMRRASTTGASETQRSGEADREDRAEVTLNPDDTEVRASRPGQTSAAKSSTFIR